jgi:hypothetical protein
LAGGFKRRTCVYQSVTDDSRKKTIGSISKQDEAIPWSNRKEAMVEVWPAEIQSKTARNRKDTIPQQQEWEAAAFFLFSKQEEIAIPWSNERSDE